MQETTNLLVPKWVWSLLVLFVLLIGLLALGGCAGEPPSYQHVYFCLKSYPDSEWEKDIYVYAEKGQTIEVKFTWLDEFGCSGLDFYMLPPNPEGYGSICGCYFGCIESMTFRPKCDETGYYKMHFSNLDAEDWWCDACVDLYYRVR